MFHCTGLIRIQEQRRSVLLRAAAAVISHHINVLMQDVCLKKKHLVWVRQWMWNKGKIV